MASLQRRKASLREIFEAEDTYCMDRAVMSTAQAFKCLSLPLSIENYNCFVDVMT